ARVPVPLGKLKRKLPHTGRPHGDESLPFTLRHLCRLVESALEYLFEVGDERWHFALGALGVAALSRLELVLFRGPARTDFILVLRRRLRSIVVQVGPGVLAMVLNL